MYVILQAALGGDAFSYSGLIALVGSINFPNDIIDLTGRTVMTYRTLCTDENVFHASSSDESVEAQDPSLLASVSEYVIPDVSGPLPIFDMPSVFYNPDVPTSLPPPPADAVLLIPESRAAQGPEQAAMTTANSSVPARDEPVPFPKDSVFSSPGLTMGARRKLPTETHPIFTLPTPNANLANMPPYTPLNIEVPHLENILPQDNVPASPADSPAATLNEFVIIPQVNFQSMYQPQEMAAIIPPAAIQIYCVNSKKSPSLATTQNQPAMTQSPPYYTLDQQQQQFSQPQGPMQNQPTTSQPALSYPVSQPPQMPHSPSQMPHSPPKMPQSPPRMPQSPPRMPQSPPRMPQSPPRRPQSPPRTPQSPPTSPTTTPTTSRVAPQANSNLIVESAIPGNKFRLYITPKFVPKQC